MTTTTRWLSLALVGVLTAAAAGVLVGHAAHHAQAAGSGCSAGIVRHLPCAEAATAATVDFHLGAYHLLTNAVAAAVALIAAAVVIGWLNLRRLIQDSNDRTARLRLWPMPARLSRAFHPWAITQRLGRWLVQTEHNPAATA